MVGLLWLSCCCCIWVVVVGLLLLYLGCLGGGYVVVVVVAPLSSWLHCHRGVMALIMHALGLAARTHLHLYLVP